MIESKRLQVQVLRTYVCMHRPPVCWLRWTPIAPQSKGTRWLYCMAVALREGAAFAASILRTGTAAGTGGTGTRDQGCMGCHYFKSRWKKGRVLRGVLR
jgi:hypothetical protein